MQAAADFTKPLPPETPAWLEFGASNPDPRRPGYHEREQALRNASMLALEAAAAAQDQQVAA